MRRSAGNHRLDCGSPDWCPSSCSDIIRLPGLSVTTCSPVPHISLADQDNHKPFIDDDLPEYDGVLYQREEDEEHAGEEPHLQGCHRVRHGDTGGGGVEHIY